MLIRAPKVASLFQYGMFYSPQGQRMLKLLKFLGSLRSEGIAQVVECRLSMHEVLGSPETPSNKQTNPITNTLPKKKVTQFKFTEQKLEMKTDQQNYSSLHFKI